MERSQRSSWDSLTSRRVTVKDFGLSEWRFSRTVRQQESFDFRQPQEVSTMLRPGCTVSQN